MPDPKPLTAEEIADARRDAEAHPCGFTGRWLATLDARDQEIAAARKVLAEYGFGKNSEDIEDACRQVLQSWMTWKGNYDTAASELATLKAIGSTPRSPASRRKGGREPIAMWSAAREFILRVMGRPSTRANDLEQNIRALSERLRRSRERLEASLNPRESTNGNGSTTAGRSGADGPGSGD